MPDGISSHLAHNWLPVGGDNSYNRVYGLKEGDVLSPGSLILLKRS